MNQIITNAINIINRTPNCINYKNKEDCITCLRDSFYYQKNDTYDCLKKLCYYTINYGPAYVNEIYSFLSKSKLLEKFDKQILNIYSLGCGFGPDFIAMNKYINKNVVSFGTFYYFGFDIEPLWRNITQDATPILADLIQVPLNYNYVDIVFINKLYSTLKNHNLNEFFLNRFQEDLLTLPVSSYVVFNDINHKDMGRDEFDKFMIDNGFEIVAKYFFNIENAYASRDYIELDTNIYVCNVPDNLKDYLNNFEFNPKCKPNKTIFFLYQKVN